MIRALGMGAGALAGAALVGIARRARSDARERGVGLGSALTALPQTLQADAAALKEDAAAAVEDGRAAGATRQREITESIEAALNG